MAEQAPGTFSFTFLVGWTLLLVVWIVAGLTVGPGAYLYLRP